jgi:imidazoleglycerol phosphate synthase glutamine amidotransferase subunit HisH
MADVHLEALRNVTIAIKVDNIYDCQFCPEESSAARFKILNQFL